MSTKKNYIFFLGGNDLEMLKIRKILEQRKYTFYDKNLLWGCKASEYDNELKNLKEDEIAVLLELQIDIDIPQNSIIVDHHNEKEGNESSLKRIADLLGISLTRQQELISANDKGFIPAMEKLCATEKEILEIRKLDRKAQGVTEEDEKNAEESIEKNKSEENSVTIIKSKTDKFSPIVDRMYKKTDNLLIYNDDKLTFYGKRKTKVVELLVQKKIKLYYGGGERGYVGIGNGELSKEELLNVKDEIVDMNLGNEEDIYSYHIFLFPFKWQRWDLELKTLKNKFSIEYFECELLKGEWNRERFKLDYCDHYNEFNYFYDYVREILYDFDEELISKIKENDENLIRHFKYKLKEGDTYNIKLFGEKKIYSLEIDRILLNVYRTGTAVLSFHLRNHNYPAQEDILKINKFGRRLYVPFFDLEPDSIFTGQPDITKKDQLLFATKKMKFRMLCGSGKKKLKWKTKHDMKILRITESLQIIRMILFYYLNLSKVYFPNIFFS